MSGYFSPLQTRTPFSSLWSPSTPSLSPQEMQALSTGGSAKKTSLSPAGYNINKAYMILGKLRPLQKNNIDTHRNNEKLYILYRSTHAIKLLEELHTLCGNEKEVYDLLAHEKIDCRQMLAPLLTHELNLQEKTKLTNALFHLLQRIKKSSIVFNMLQTNERDIIVRKCELIDFVETFRTPTQSISSASSATSETTIGTNSTLPEGDDDVFQGHPPISTPINEALSFYISEKSYRCSRTSDFESTARSVFS